MSKLNIKYINGTGPVGSLLSTDGAGGYEFINIPRNGEIERIFLKDLDIQRGYVDLKHTVSEDLREYTIIELPGAPSQLYGSDFVITNNEQEKPARLSWNSLGMSELSLSTDDVIVVRYFDDTVVFPDVSVYIATITEDDITNKHITLPNNIALSRVSETRMFIKGCPGFSYGDDFYAAENRLIWQSKTMELFVEVGMNVLVVYKKG